MRYKSVIIEKQLLIDGFMELERELNSLEEAVNKFFLPKLNFRTIYAYFISGWTNTTKSPSLRENRLFKVVGLKGMRQ